MSAIAGFAYVAPTGVDEALKVISNVQSQGGRAQVLAGGTDLIVQMRAMDKAPRTLVDLKGVAEARRLEVGATETFIGATIPSAILNEDPRLVKMFPGLMEAADLIGSTQIQGRASIGGNLCNASPAGDTIPALIANGAVCVIANGSGGREMAVEDFVVGVQKNALRPGEFLLGIKLRNPGARASDAYLRFIPRTEMDIAVAGCGVALTLDASGVCTAARVGIGAVAPRALLVPEAAKALIGTQVDDAALNAAGAACTAASSPISDRRGTADYRRKVIAVLCRRAGAIARDRALGV
jgi:carbon-monoxide dehydrogenase medium subunit